jgi:cytochrome c oxidase cbb3-type subunit III
LTRLRSLLASAAPVADVAPLAGVAPVVHLAIVAFVAFVLFGCGVPPGKPRAGSETLAPNDVLDFAVLYAGNCAGCHGAEGRGGPAIALSNPVFLAIADDQAVRKVMVSGVRGTAMPAFAQSSGGMLTDQQIAVITTGMRARWSKPGILEAANPPPYVASSAGDVSRGDLAYKTYCESCHGPNGQGTAKASAITNDSFLALMSDQGLRTVVITGRPELGAPDWRGNVSGKPMSNQEVTDVVAWLVSRRVANPGQPYAVANQSQQ